VGGVIAKLQELAAQLSLETWAIVVICALLAALISLGVDHARLRRRHAKIESELFETTVGKESTNWTNTALNLERKARDPGVVARSSAMTHLHMLDEAANAWLKGSQWPEALRVTQELLRECCHAITKPSINEDDFRATSDLIKRALERYPDVSKAANEAIENARHFLITCDSVLALLSGSALIQDLRERAGDACAAIERKPRAA
jgi:hypothetical protein